MCIWYPGDGEDQRWVPEDGLLALLGMTAVHLFKEAYWRETGEWLGEEAPHGVNLKEVEEVSPTARGRVRSRETTRRTQGRERQVSTMPVQSILFSVLTAAMRA